MSKDDWRIKYAEELALGDSVVLPQNEVSRHKASLKQKAARAKTGKATSSVALKKVDNDLKSRPTQKVNDVLGKAKQKAAGARAKGKKMASRVKTNRAGATKGLASVSRHSSAQCEPTSSNPEDKAASVNDAKKAAGEPPKFRAKMTKVKNRMKNSGLKFFHKIMKSAVDHNGADSNSKRTMTKRSKLKSTTNAATTKNAKVKSPKVTAHAAAKGCKPSAPVKGAAAKSAKPSGAVAMKMIDVGRTKTKKRDVLSAKQQVSLDISFLREKVLYSGALFATLAVIFTSRNPEVPTSSFIGGLEQVVHLWSYEKFPIP